MTRPSTLGALALAAALAACAPTAPAGPALPQRPAVDASQLVYPELGEIPAPALERRELSNGVVVFVVEDRSLPLVQLRGRFGAGRKADPADHVGLASIAASAMRTGGTESMAPDSVDLALENVGASITVSAGDDVVFFGARTLTDTAPEVMRLLAEMITAPRFDEDKVELAKTQQKSAISRRNDNPGGIANRELFKAIYGADSPEARTAEYWTVDAVSRQDLVDWHARHVVPATTSLVVIGDVDADDAVAHLEAAFAGWTTPAGFEPVEVDPETPEREARLVFIEKDDVEQSNVLIGHAGSVRRDHPDYPALIVMNEVLGGGFSGRMLRTIRTDLGLAYGASGVYTADYDGPGVFYTGTSTKTESTVAALRAMRDVIASIQEVPPSEEELALAKESYLNSFVFNFDTPTEVADRALAYEVEGYPADFLQRLKAGVEAVTAEDVQRVAREYLHPDEAVTLVLGRSADFDEPLTALGAVDTLDIAIPTVPPGGAAAAGSEAEGRALLAAAAAALGGAEAFAAVEALKTVAVTEAETPAGTIEVTSTTTIGLPSSLRAEQTTPFGSVTILISDGEASLVTPAGPQEAPPGIEEQVQGQLFLSIPYLMSRADELAVESVPGAPRSVQITAPGVPSPYTLTLGDDDRPAEIVSVQATQAGPAEVRVRIEDYREVGGFVLPFRYVQLTDGEPSGTTAVQSIEIDPELPEGTFGS